MRIDRIRAARAEALRLVRLADAAIDRAKSDHEAWVEYADDPTTSPISIVGYTRESGALRRASLDLTRALAEMRKP